MKRFITNITLTLLLILLLIFAAVYDLRGQGIEAAVYTQKTVMGNQLGYSVGLRSERGFGLMAIHQATPNRQLESGASSYPFSGAEFSIPVKTCDNLKLFTNVKTGLVNKQFFIVTPEVETRLSFTPWLHLSVGAGIRSREAAISAKISISTF